MRSTSRGRRTEWLPPLAAFAVVWTLGPPLAAAPTARIHVHGAARIEARAARSAAGLVVSGTLRDDTGTLVPKAPLSVAVTDSAGAPVLLGPGNVIPTACEAFGAATPLEGNVASLRADDAGRFCVRFPLPVARYVAHIHTTAEPLLDPADVDLACNLAQASVLLSFDPEPHGLDLDSPSLALDVLALEDDDGIAVAARDLTVDVGSDTGPIGRVTTGVSGRARLNLDVKRLGPPGLGELTVHFDGNAGANPSDHRTAVERRAIVHLALLAPPAARSDEEADVDLTVTTIAGPVESGAVEVDTAGIALGGAPVEHGRAHLSVVVPGAAGQYVGLTLRYVADVPWLRPGDEIATRVALQGPGIGRSLSLVLASLLVVGALAFGRLRRRPANAEVREVAPPPSRPAKATVQLVREAQDPNTGWEGRVVDAHEGWAIAGAEVIVTRPAFQRGEETVHKTSTSRDGKFRIPPLEPGPDRWLRVEGPLHAALRRPLPRAGELEVALVSRRRRLLETLVEWSKRRGKPYDQRPEPTPAHVRRAAGPGTTVAKWADATERAVYGPDPVTAAAEGEVSALTPEAPER